MHQAVPHAAAPTTRNYLVLSAIGAAALVLALFVDPFSALRAR